MCIRDRFDTCAAVLAALVILPAMAAAGETLDAGGPGLMFIYLPNVLREIPGGGVILAVFFIAVAFAALTSLINLFEAPIATLQEFFHLRRPAAVAVIGLIGIVVGLLDVYKRQGAYRLRARPNRKASDALAVCAFVLSRLQPGCIPRPGRKGDVYKRQL